MKKNLEDILIEKISNELGFSGSEGKLAYEIFIKRISLALQYDETIKIPFIGLFQKRRGQYIGNIQKDTTSINQDTLVYSPFSNNKDNIDFAYYNIPIKTKNAVNIDFDENIYSLSINKPIITFSKSGVNASDPNTSLILLKKSIEDKINQIITKSDFLEGLNLWEDFIESSQTDNLTLDEVFEDKKTKDDDLLVSNYGSIFENKEESDSNFTVQDSAFGFEITDSDILNEENNESTNFENEEIIENIDSKNIQSEDLSDVLSFNIEDNLDVENTTDGSINEQADQSYIDNLFKMNNQEDDSNANADQSYIDNLFKMNNQDETIEDIIEDSEKERDPLLDLSQPGDVELGKNDDFDWNKELEEELFANPAELDSEINFDTISQDNVSNDESFDDDEDSKEQDNEFIIPDNDEADEIIDDNRESLNDTLVNSSESGSKSLEEDIDELFDSLPTGQKDVKPEKKSKFSFKLNFNLKLNKIIIILISLVVLIGIVGAVYFFFFKGTDEHKEIEKKPVVKEEVNKIAKPIVKEDAKIDSILSASKKDSVLRTDEKIGNDSKTAKEENNTENKIEDKSRKSETTNSKNSIIEKKEIKEVKPLPNTNLYKKIGQERAISEKIYFDGKVYNIQTSSWQSKTKAELEVKRFRRLGFDAYVVEVELNQLGKWYRVKIFEFKSQQDAKNFITQNNL